MGSVLEWLDVAQDLGLLLAVPALAGFATFKLGWWALDTFVPGPWLLRASLTAFSVVNTVAALAAYGYYRSLVEYCEPENEYLGGSGLDCLEPYNWWFIDGLVLLWSSAAIGLAALVVAAYRRRGRVTHAG